MHMCICVCACVCVVCVCVHVCVHMCVMCVCVHVCAVCVCVCVHRRDSNLATSETLQGIVQGVIQVLLQPHINFTREGSLLAITLRHSNIHTCLACYLHTLSYGIIGLGNCDLLHPACVSSTTIFLTCFQ